MSSPAPQPAKKGIKDKIVGMIEEHPVIVAAVVAGAILGVVTLRRMAGGNTSSSGNTMTGSSGGSLPVFTDASGNPIDPYTGQPIPGASVSPQLTNSDVATLLQDMEQQILNWESSFQPNSGSTSGNTGGSTSGNTGGSVPPAGPFPNPGSGNPPTNPPTNPPVNPSPPPSNPVTQLWATVTKWPSPGSSLWTIFQNPINNPTHLSWQAWESNVLRLNPAITNPNLVYPNERIRIE